MKILNILYLAFFVVAAKALPLDECVLRSNGVKYKEETVSTTCESLYAPQNFAVDHISNTLYLSHQNRKNNRQESLRINLSTGQCSVIAELSDDCSFTVDQRLHNVYAGCSNGLYHYDTNIEKFVLIRSGEVRYVYFNSNFLFFISLNPEDVYKFSYANISVAYEFDDDVQQMVIDNDDDKIYLNGHGIYRKKASSGITIHYKYSVGNTALAVDSIGNTYACDYHKDKISIVNKELDELEKLVDASWCHSITFDKEDNLLYADWEEDEIVRLRKC